MKIKKLILTAVILFFVSNASFSQKGYQDTELPIVKLRIDSLQKRNERLKIALSKNKSDLAKYHRIKGEIALTNFRLEYEQHYVNETLDQAKVLVDKKIRESHKNNRNDLVKIYEEYKKDITRRIKNQRIKYQTLFQKEKVFKKFIQPYFDENTTKSLAQAVFLCDLALRFATEQRVVTAQKFITEYKNKGQAYIYDHLTDYDLSALTKSKGKFNKQFTPLISSDSIAKLNQAKVLVEECTYYSERISTKLPILFFNFQMKVVNSKLLEKEQELAILGVGGQDLVVKHTQPMDAVNDYGIFRFYDKIVVIGRFNPTDEGMNAVIASDIRVMKGMAIIKADVMLTTYVNKKIQHLKPNSKIIYAYFIPYLVDGKYQWFMPANKKGDQQYRVAYTFVHSEKLTKALLQEHLKPIVFEEADDDSQMSTK